MGFIELITLVLHWTTSIALTDGLSVSTAPLNLGNSQKYHLHLLDYFALYSKWKLQCQGQLLNSCF